MEMNESENLSRKWLDKIGKPDHYEYEHELQLVRIFETDEFAGELYEQANGPGTTQRTLLMLPKTIGAKRPAVVVPFYSPDLMAGYKLDTLERTDEADIAMALHLVRRGYIAVTAEAYHLTYRELELDSQDFLRWQLSAEALLSDQPGWTGIGKLMADTQLLVDLLCKDPRVDRNRIAIAGHSLGGKMALYAGCLDDRIKAILGSDFGLEWDRTNWSKPWYWGEKLDELKAADMDHAELLRLGGLKPFVLIAGESDSDEAHDMIKKAGYSESSQYLFINHASGHRPPKDVLDKGYDFLQTCF